MHETGTTLEIDIAALQTFEDGLDPVHPEASAVPATILAYGEISAVLALPFQPGVVFKRMCGFPDAAAAQTHQAAVETYIAQLRAIGLTVPATRVITMRNRHGEHVFYVAQERAAKESIGNAYLRNATGAQLEAALRAVLDAVIRVWTFNRDNCDGIALGLDAQISNWRLVEGPNGAMEVAYFDVATPLMRRDGQEIMDVRMLIKSLPAPLRWTIEALFLEEVVQRYYDLHLVLSDLAGNFHKEGYPEKIDPAIALIDRHLAEAAPGLLEKPLDRKTIDAYYRRDKWIWIIFLEFRKWHRALYTKILRKRYPFILPGKIRR